MMGSAVESPARSDVRVRAVASMAIRDVVTAPMGRALVLGGSSHAVWLDAGDEVIVVSTADATRLPNGVEIPLDAATLPFDRVRHGELAAVGSGRIELAGLSVEVARWWDPRPALPRVTVGALWRAISWLPGSVEGIDPAPMRASLCAGSPSGLLAAAESLLGRGPGLTPEGDDYVAGIAAATRALGGAAAHPFAVRLIDAIEVPLISMARRRTTTFSADLIRYAVNGGVAAPAGAFLRALAGRGDVGESHRALLDVGHSSGPALAAGMVLAAHCLVISHAHHFGGDQ